MKTKTVNKLAVIFGALILIAIVIIIRLIQLNAVIS